MCKAAQFFALAVAFACAAARPLAAQSAASVSIRAQERLVDSLVIRHHATIAALKTFEDSTTRAAMHFDSLRIGNLRALVDPAIRERAERAARIASARIDSLAGSAAGRLASTWLVIRAARNDTVLDTLVVAIRANDPSHLPHIREYLTVWGTPSDSALVEWIYQNALNVLAASVDRPMQNWLDGQVLPDTMSTTDWLGTRLAIVSSPTSVASRCYEGDLAACKTSLRLVDAGDVVTQWFDAGSRRRFVEELRRHARTRDPDADLCVEGSDAACLTVMRKVPHLGDPISPYRRRSVAKTAIRMGGARGYERFLNATGSPAERLTATAGVPLDSVLRAWLRTVQETRRPSQDMSTGIAFSSLGWILVCGVLALRSSRWR